MAGKKITELSSGSLSNLPLSGVTTVVYSGTTFQHNLTDLRNKLVDSGSHYFTGSQFINGDLTISGSITAQEYILSSSITNITTETISGSSNFGNSDDDTHTFTGSVNITGSLFMNGDEVVISGSGSHIAFFDGNKSLRWYDSFHAIEGGNTLALGVDQTSLGGSNSEYREKLIVASNDSHNIATFQGGAGNHYAALNIINFNSGSNASADLVIMNDIQNESSSYVNLGINSTTHTNLTCGYEGDSYLFNTSDDFYIGNLNIGNNLETNGHTHLFSAGAWRHPSISMYGNTSVGFFTEKPDNQLYVIPSYNDGFKSEFSGSVKMNNDLKVDGWVSGSHFVGDGSGLYNLPQQDLSNLATTGSNTFSGSQIVLGDFNIENSFQVFGDSILEGNTLFEGPLTASNGVYSNLIYPLSGSDTITIDSPNLNVDTITANSLVVTGSVSGDGFDRFATTGSNTFIGDQQITGSVYIQEGDSLQIGDNAVFTTGEGSIAINDSTGYIQLNALNNDGSGNYATLTLNANSDQSVFSANDNTFGRVGASINLSTSGSFNISTHNNTATLLIDGVLYDSHLVSTSSFNSFTASVATTGSNDFVGDQTIDGIIYLQDPGNELGDTAQIVNNGDALILSAQDDRKITLSVYSGSVYDWEFGVDGDLTVPGNINGAPNLATTGSNTFNGDQTINGSLIIEGVSEVLTIDGGFSGNRDFDYTSGSIFYLTGLTGNGTWNINNVPTTNDRGVTMTFVVEQGGTPYSGSAYSFDSTPVTVKWVDSTVPTGSANKTEVIGLTAFRVGSSWNVLGSLSTFGS